MAVEVIVRRPVKLTETQIGMLRFLGGQQDMPPVRLQAGTFNVLVSNGLIKWGGRRRHKYRITDVGQDVLTQIAEAGDHPAT
jgi:hypothetical protein